MRDVATLSAFIAGSCGKLAHRLITFCRRPTRTLDGLSPRAATFASSAIKARRTNGLPALARCRV